MLEEAEGFPSLLPVSPFTVQFTCLLVIIRTCWWEKYGAGEDFSMGGVTAAEPPYLKMSAQICPKR